MSEKLVALLRQQSKLGPINVARAAMKDAADTIDALEAHKRAQTEDIMRLGAMVGRMLHIADTNGFGDAAREVLSPKPAKAGKVRA